MSSISAVNSITFISALINVGLPTAEDVRLRRMVLGNMVHISSEFIIKFTVQLVVVAYFVDTGNRSENIIIINYQCSCTYCILLTANPINSFRYIVSVFGSTWNCFNVSLSIATSLFGLTKGD